MRMKGKKVIFDRMDTLNLETTLSPVIAAGLKKFKEVILEDNVAGYPMSVLGEDSLISHHSAPALIPDEEEGVKIDPDYDKMDDEGFVLWIEILDKMIYAFDAGEPELPTEKYLDMIISDEPDESGNFPVEFKILNQEIYDSVNLADKVHADKVQEGLDLFAKHYKGLWW